MSGLGNFVAGAVGGAGAGVASIASRYIDDEIQRNRAQALADIQHNSMVRAEEYQQSAPVQERRLGNERNLLQMRNQENLAGRVAEASSPELRQARIDDRVQYLQGTTPAEIESQNAITAGTAGAKLDAERIRTKVMTPLEAERAGAISEAQWRARSEYDDRLDKTANGGKGAKMSEAGKLQLQDLNKQDEALQKAINDGVAGGTLKQDPNDPAWQHFTRQKQALQVQKMRVFAREGLISGADDAANLLAAGATQADIQTSLKQAQLIGGSYAADFAAALRAPSGRPSKAEAIQQDAARTGTKDFIVDINGTRAAYGNAKLPEAQASGGGSGSSQNLVEQRRTQQSAPPGSPQAKWEARQQQLRDEAASRENDRRARVERARAEFDADAKSMDALELVRKYSDPASRSGLDTARLTRLNQIERTIR